MYDNNYTDFRFENLKFLIIDISNFERNSSRLIKRYFKTIQKYYFAYLFKFRTRLYPTNLIESLTERYFIDVLISRYL